MHEVEPRFSVNWPEGQGTQLDWPMAAAKYCAGHAVQASDPVDAWYWPEAQDEHDDDPAAEYSPDGQLEHEICPAVP